MKTKWEGQVHQIFFWILAISATNQVQSKRWEMWFVDSFKFFYDSKVCMMGQLLRYLDECIEDFASYKITNLVHLLFCVCTMYKVFNVVSPWSSPSPFKLEYM